MLHIVAGAEAAKDMGAHRDGGTHSRYPAPHVSHDDNYRILFDVGALAAPIWTCDNTEGVLLRQRAVIGHKIVLEMLHSFNHNMSSFCDRELRCSTVAMIDNDRTAIRS